MDAKLNDFTEEQNANGPEVARAPTFESKDHRDRTSATGSLNNGIVRKLSKMDVDLSRNLYECQ